MEHNEEMLLDIYEFVKKSFKVGAVPNTFNEFKENFSTETTDNSLCFAYNFDENKDDTAMMFFYPTHVTVPGRYQKNLVFEFAGDINLLSLEYNKLGIKYSNNIDFLNELKNIINDRYNLLSSIAFRRMLIATPEKIKEIEKRQKHYLNKHNEVLEDINSKILELSPTYEDDSLPSM